MTEAQKRELRALAGDLREHVNTGVDVDKVVHYVAGELEKLADEAETE
jgi:hypothetical protein